MSTLEDDLVVALLGPWRRRRERRASEAVATALAPWSAANGFTALEPLHPDVIYHWAEALLLVDADKDREVGTALCRRHARGALHLFDSYGTSFTGRRATTAVMTTSASLRGVSGEHVVLGLPAGSLVQRSPRRLVVHIPRPLTVAVASPLTHRLTRLEAALPDRPGAARL